MITAKEQALSQFNRIVAMACQWQLKRDLRFDTACVLSVVGHLIRQGNLTEVESGFFILPQEAINSVLAPLQYDRSTISRRLSALAEANLLVVHSMYRADKARMITTLNLTPKAAADLDDIYPKAAVILADAHNASAKDVPKDTTPAFQQLEYDTYKVDPARAEPEQQITLRAFPPDLARVNKDKTLPLVAFVPLESGKTYKDLHKSDWSASTLTVRKWDVRMSAGMLTGDVEQLKSSMLTLNKHLLSRWFSTEIMSWLVDYQLVFMLDYIKATLTDTNLYPLIMSNLLARYTTDIRQDNKWSLETCKRCDKVMKSRRKVKDRNVWFDKASGKLTAPSARNNLFADLVVASCWHIICPTRPVPVSSDGRRYWKFYRGCHYIINDALHCGLDLHAYAKAFAASEDVAHGSWMDFVRGDRYPKFRAKLLANYFPYPPTAVEMLSQSRYSGPGAFKLLVPTPDLQSYMEVTRGIEQEAGVYKRRKMEAVGLLQQLLGSSGSLPPFKELPKLVASELGPQEIAAVAEAAGVE